MLFLSVGSISQHLNFILLWVVFKINSSNRCHFNASQNLHSSQDCLIPVLITVLITAVCHSSTHNMYAYSMSSCIHCSAMALDTDIHCKACWQLTPFHLWMSVPTLYLLSMVRHDNSVLLVALHGTPMDFCHGELIFWCTDASASWTSMSEWSGQYCDIYVWNTCVLLHMYPYIDWNIANTWCVLSQLYTPFPILPHCWPKTSCHDLQRIQIYVCMYVHVCTCVFACAYQPCPQSLFGQVLNLFLPTAVYTKSTTWYCTLIVKLSITVF